MVKNISQESTNILKEFSSIKSKHGYQDFDNKCHIQNQVSYNYLESNFYCHDKLPIINEVNKEKSKIVTGFGPTNAPTAATLSVILKTISLQKLTGIETEIIISDLGAWNSRNLSLKELEGNTNKFVSFIKELGFNLENGKIRTHKSPKELKHSGIISKFMKESDFLSNKEATDNLYDMLSLRGSQFGVMIDSLYTITDIISPLLEGKERVLVLAGLEEHYFPQLSRIALKRMKEYQEDSIDNLVSDNSSVCAIYTKLINGLSPYPKMSKSIPASSINISDNKETLEKKIMYCKEEDEYIILQLIHLVSDWSPSDIDEAHAIFEKRNEFPYKWHDCKERYLNYFYDITCIWNTINNEK